MKNGSTGRDAGPHCSVVDDAGCNMAQKHASAAQASRIFWMNDMPVPPIGSSVADFSLPTDRGNLFRLSAHKGHYVVLFFYAEDDTEGCTVENLEFTSLYHAFRDLGAEVLGISPDSIEKHCRFRDKHALTVPLGSDPDRTVIEAFGLWQKKKMFGVEFMGVRRASCIIDPEGTLAAFVLAPRIKGHAQRVLEILRSLQA